MKDALIRCIRWVLPLVITVAMARLLIGDAGIEDIIDRLGHIKPIGLVFFPVMWLCSSFCRARIYWLLLGRRYSWVELIPLMWLRSLTVDLLPARGGLATIPAALRVIWRVPVSSGIATVAGATVAELTALGFMVLLALFLSPSTLPEGWALILMLGGIGLVLIFPLALLVAHHVQSIRETGRISRWIRRLAEETAHLKSRGCLLPVLSLTLIVRLFKYGGLYLLFDSLAPGAMMPISFLSAMIAAEATSALPVQGLAGVGTWEAAWVQVSSRLGLASDVAVSTGFSLHLLVLTWEILMGVIGVGILILIRARKR